jgi:hypothetical protein
MAKTGMAGVPAAELVRAGRDPEDLAREFEPTSQSIRNWVAQADRSEGRREETVGSTSNAERAPTAPTVFSRSYGQSAQAFAPVTNRGWLFDRWWHRVGNRPLRYPV